LESTLGSSVLTNLFNVLFNIRYLTFVCYLFCLMFVFKPWFMIILLLVGLSRKQTH